MGRFPEYRDERAGERWNEWNVLDEVRALVDNSGSECTVHVGSWFCVYLWLCLNLPNYFCLIDKETSGCFASVSGE